MKKSDYHKKTFKPVVEYQATDILVGAEVYISTEDASGILTMSVLEPDIDQYSEQRNMTMLYECRTLLRNIAKSVLYNNINATKPAELMNKFNLSFETTDSVELDPKK